MSDKHIYPLLLMIGVMKCGTTSLFRYLRQHPQICASSIKEPHFFSDDRTYSQGLDWYLRLWDWDSSVHRWALEASTGYTHPRNSGKIAERIARTGAEIRLLYVVRDPLKRIESDYNHAYSAGWIKREVGIDDLIELRPDFIARSRYAMQLDPYRIEFGSDRILVINASDLSADPTAEMERVVRFLGLAEYSFEGLGKVHNPGRGRIVDSTLITRLRRYRSLFEGLRKYAPSSVQLGVRQVLGRRLTETFKLSESSRKRILELLDEDLRRLQHEYGVDIGKWGIDVAAKEPSLRDA